MAPFGTSRRSAPSAVWHLAQSGTSRSLALRAVWHFAQSGTSRSLAPRAVQQFPLVPYERLTRRLRETDAHCTRDRGELIGSARQETELATHDRLLHRRDDPRIELRTRVPLQLRERLLERELVAAIRAAARHRVDRVRDGDDASLEGDRLAYESVGHSASIHPLVMRTHDAQGDRRLA